jgi:uncharacterized membrane protein
MMNIDQYIRERGYNKELNVEGRIGLIIFIALCIVFFGSGVSMIFESFPDCNGWGCEYPETEFGMNNILFILSLISGIIILIVMFNTETMDKLKIDDEMRYLYLDEYESYLAIKNAKKIRAQRLNRAKVGEL